jgi:hypothetical protein
VSLPVPARKGPVNATPVKTSGKVPDALVTVTVWAALVVPTGCAGKLIEDGAIVGGMGCGPLGVGVPLAEAARPLPNNCTVCGLAGLLWALSLKVSLPV